MNKEDLKELWDIYFSIFRIACIGSKYGDFEGVQGLGV